MVGMLEIGGMMTDTLLLAIVIHLICDWLFQNDWMARNKHEFGTAMGVHSGIHFLGMLLVFPVPIAFMIAALHALVDTRIPLKFWSNLIKQTDYPPYDIHVQLWSDQVLHIAILTIVTLAHKGMLR